MVDGELVDHVGILIADTFQLLKLFHDPGVVIVHFLGILGQVGDLCLGLLSLELLVFLELVKCILQFLQAQLVLFLAVLNALGLDHSILVGFLEIGVSLLQGHNAVVKVGKASKALVESLNLCLQVIVLLL